MCKHRQRAAQSAATCEMAYFVLDREPERGERLFRGVQLALQLRYARLRLWDCVLSVCCCRALLFELLGLRLQRRGRSRELLLQRTRVPELSREKLRQRLLQSVQQLQNSGQNTRPAERSITAGRTQRACRTLRCFSFSPTVAISRSSSVSLRAAASAAFFAALRAPSFSSVSRCTLLSACLLSR